MGRHACVDVVRPGLVWRRALVEALHHLHRELAGSGRRHPRLGNVAGACLGAPAWFNVGVLWCSTGPEGAVHGCVGLPACRRATSMQQALNGLVQMFGKVGLLGLLGLLLSVCGVFVQQTCSPCILSRVSFPPIICQHADKGMPTLAYDDLLACGCRSRSPSWRGGPPQPPPPGYYPDGPGLRGGSPPYRGGYRSRSPGARGYGPPAHRKRPRSRSYSRSHSRSYSRSRSPSRSRSRNRGRYRSYSRGRDRAAAGGGAGAAASAGGPAMRSKQELAADLARIAEVTRLASLQQAAMTPQALQLSRHARRVYVGNLPHNVTETALTHYFNQVGGFEVLRVAGSCLRILQCSWWAVCARSSDTARQAPSTLTEMA